MMKPLFTLSMLLSGALTYAQSGNYVFSGAEQTSFGTTDLATPTGGSWSTARAATPGYFSATGPSGTFTGAADGGTALVDGYVKFYASAANQSFSFPVGVNGATAAEGDLRTLSVSGTLPDNAIIATAWIAGNPVGNLDPTSTGASSGPHSTASLGTGIMSVSKLGQWDWQDLNNNAAGATITVSIPALSNATAANLRLVGWNGSQWIDLSTSQGSSAASGNTENSTLTGTMQSGISAIGIGATDIALPVTLLDFTASIEQGDQVLLSWEVANEKSFAHYEVEYATDAVQFTPVCELAGGQPEGRYALVHKQPDQEAFYRLKMVDLDHNFTYSKVVKVALGAVEQEFMVYPNPAINTAKVKGTREGDQLQLYTADGELLYTMNATGDFALLNMEAYSGGVYLLSVSRQGKPVYQSRLIKK
ncbi:hypothetical protein DBR32_14700 [Taibaiella sp. KBW10]|uniref:T9SS type A sorting domain-containing protein n=1 Tax=Taibaiella sp. KBW10 TaxID=2153357 RepID=UPI000F5A4D8F|nr:T9SS type A sorting domain-containing protein [Taibaiella sp. KBW10]RQO29830.1 hypothetical protein DBR32_14700 [Taibaiella sp. KBW10]